MAGGGFVWSCLLCFFFKRDKRALTQAAIRDHHNTFVVQEIDAHRGNLSGSKKQIEFHVRWLGYEEWSWEPFHELRNNAILHEYLARGPAVHGEDAAKLRRLIPNRIVQVPINPRAGPGEGV